MGRVQFGKLEVARIPGAENDGRQGVVQLVVKQVAADLRVGSLIAPPGARTEGGLQEAADRLAGSDVAPIDRDLIQVSTGRAAKVGARATGDNIGAADTDRDQVGRELVEDRVADVNAVHRVVDLVLVGPA